MNVVLYLFIKLTVPLQMSSFIRVGAIVSDFDLRLQVSSSGPSSSIPAGWYSSSSSSSSFEDNNKNGEELLGNVPVNELNEWNVNKLGWIKSYDAAAGKLLPDENVLKNAFSLKVLNCQRNEYSAELNSAFIGPDQLNRARRLKEIFPFIRQVQLFSRHVEVRFTFARLPAATRIKIANHCHGLSGGLRIYYQNCSVINHVFSLNICAYSLQELIHNVFLFRFRTPNRLSSS